MIFFLGFWCGRKQKYCADCRFTSLFHKVRKSQCFGSGSAGSVIFPVSGSGSVKKITDPDPGCYFKNNGSASIHRHCFRNYIKHFASFPKLLISHIFLKDAFLHLFLQRLDFQALKFGPEVKTLVGSQLRSEVRSSQFFHFFHFFKKWKKWENRVDRTSDRGSDQGAIRSIFSFFSIFKKFIWCQVE